jgi:hypothetical protein
MTTARAARRPVSLSPCEDLGLLTAERRLEHSASRHVAVLTRKPHVGICFGAALAVETVPPCLAKLAKPIYTRPWRTHEG